MATSRAALVLGAQLGRETWPGGPMHAEHDFAHCASPRPRHRARTLSSRPRRASARQRRDARGRKPSAVFQEESCAAARAETDAHVVGYQKLPEGNGGARVGGAVSAGADDVPRGAALAHRLPGGQMEQLSVHHVRHAYRLRYGLFHMSTDDADFDYGEPGHESTGLCGVQPVHRSPCRSDRSWHAPSCLRRGRR